jgi:hypothetical protein
MKLRPAWMLQERAEEAVWRARAGPPELWRAEESEAAERSEGNGLATTKYGRASRVEHIFTRHDVQEE